MALARMGSLNALEQSQGQRFWQRWLGEPLASADTTGRVFAQLECERVRELLHHLYSRLKRNKALKPAFGNVFALIIDGHESNASYLRRCEGCLKRRVHTAQGERIQYYHRNVTAMLLTRDFPVLLDVEPQRPGEDEVAAGTRLVTRVLDKFPRAFTVILTDGLYVQAQFFHVVLKLGKEVIAVLKDERRDLLEDARGLFRSEEPVVRQCGRTQRQCWDIEHFRSWASLGREVRVVRSLETTTVRRQMRGQEEQQRSEWVWVTTLSQEQLGTEAVVALGHARWVIENKELNELVTYWHADHVYKHHPVAIAAFWLLVMVAYNLFFAFIYLNLKPQVRFRRSNLHWARVIAAEIYHCRMYSLAPVPT